MLIQYLLHLKQDLFGLQFPHDDAILNDFSSFFQLSSLSYYIVTYHELTKAG